MSIVNIAVSGCSGKMGQVLCKHLLSHSQYKLVAGIDPASYGKDLGAMLGTGENGIIIAPDLAACLKSCEIDAVIDFTRPAAVVANIKTCLKAKTPILIGTTGISDSDRAELDALAKQNDTPALLVPNFAIGAILMMEFAQKAAKYMKDVEIIEMHHPQKIDKPSGTALLTRQKIIEASPNLSLTNDNDVPVHSVRLPGMVAHQMVIFGGSGQTLTIRHDSLSRDSFMPGIDIALGQLTGFTGLRVGLKI